MMAANSEIERRLLAVASSIDVSGDELPRLVLARLAQPPRTRERRVRAVIPSLTGRRWFVPALAAAVVAALVVIPAPRRAVARWLGIGAVHVSLDTTLPTVVPVSFPAPLPAAAEPLADSIADAERITGLKLPSSSVLGPPTNVEAVQRPLPDTLIATWPVSPSVPQTGTPGVGARLWMSRSSFDRGYFGKFAGDQPSSIENVMVGETDGLFISGSAHVVVFIGTDGNVVTDTAQLAGNTVLWAVGDVTYRLETALGRDAAVALAESLR
jgi:hypothetical protein